MEFDFSLENSNDFEKGDWMSIVFDEKMNYELDEHLFNIHEEDSNVYDVMNMELKDLHNFQNVGNSTVTESENIASTTVEHMMKCSDIQCDADELETLGTNIEDDPYLSNIDKNQIVLPCNRKIEVETSKEMNKNVEELDPYSTEKALFTSAPYKSVNQAKKARKRLHEVKWSVKNQIEGKTFRQYIQKQLKIARRLCSHIVQTFNGLNVKVFNDFVDKYYCENFMHQIKHPGKHPFTGELDTPDIFEDVVAYKKSFCECFMKVPDFVMMIDNVQVYNDGKLVRLNITTMCTPMGEYAVNDSKGNPTTYVENGLLEVFLHKFTNKVEKIVRTCVHYEFIQI